MVTIFSFIFDNILLVIVIIIIYYTYTQYKDLNKKTQSINDIFSKTLDKYLNEKINKAHETTDRILKEYGREDEISIEINRLLLMIEKGVSGTINDKVSSSNAINKFKLNKHLDLEKYPFLKELENLGTFTKEDMESKDNGIAIARREYNAQAFRYNEKASSVIMQYLTKFLKLNQQYILFDAPKSSNYEENYEVFEETEPEINSLSSLNWSEETNKLNDLIYDTKDKEISSNDFQEEITLEHNDNVLKPSTSLDEKN